MSDMEIRDGKVFYRCPSCSQWFQFGPHVYNGKTLSTGVTVCMACKPDDPMDRWIASHPRGRRR